MLSDADLASFMHRRARRVLASGIAALNAAPADGRSASQLSSEAVHEALVLAVLRFVVLSFGRARGLFRNDEAFRAGRLFAPRDARLEIDFRVQSGELVLGFPGALAALSETLSAELGSGLRSDGVDFANCPAELVGNLYELLLGETVRRDDDGQLQIFSGKKRKQTGTFFTPRALTSVVVERALAPLSRRIAASPHRHHDFVLEFAVCDPAVGGGAFLLEVGRALSALSDPHARDRKRELVLHALHGVDVNPLAVAVAEAALCLFANDPALPLQAAGANLRVGDALLGAPYRTPEEAESSVMPAGGLDFDREFPDVFARGGFDLVIGNPPWVAYAGRAAQPLPKARKAYFAARYSTLKGYPTLQGLFVERALRLAPQGTVALVVPSPIADLDGYRAVRRTLRARHTPCEPLLEFGQDAFASVTQPCFALIAEPSSGAALPPEVREAPFRLAERQRAGLLAEEVKAPAALDALASLPAFPRELFGEMGFQTTSAVTKSLLLRAPEPDARHDYPLLEGRDVREFSEGQPRLFLSPDSKVLAKSRCRLRDRNDYLRVSFVVRQTARYPIAALHHGLPFRNSLLAGFELSELPPSLVVGLLNSSLYRALHLALRRDARQATFPQVKVGHLRALPRPPERPELHARIAEMTAHLTRDGVNAEAGQALDGAVFELFSIADGPAREILAFLSARKALRA